MRIDALHRRLIDAANQFFAVSPSNAAKRIGVPPLLRTAGHTVLVGLSIVKLLWDQLAIVKLVGSID